MPGIDFEHHEHPEARTFTGLLASKNNLLHLFEAAVDLLFPPRCAGCGRVDTYWCENCERLLDEVPLDLSFKPIEFLVNVASTGVHAGKLQDAIHALKYDNVPQMAKPLGQRLVQGLNQLNWTVDIIIPVPLHTTRLSERGYNQSQLLGAQIESSCSIPCIAHGLSRQRETRSQVGLDAQHRLTNMANAFQANPSIVAQQVILLIDDVCTTGATLGACAQAVLAAGAKAVYGLTVTTARN